MFVTVAFCLVLDFTDKDHTTYIKQAFLYIITVMLIAIPDKSKIKGIVFLTKMRTLK